MQLHQLPSPAGSRTKKVRRGRGPGSGLGKQSGRGDNGQRSRSGRGIIPGLEGGQMPLIRRLPKVGFTTHEPVVYQIVPMDALNRFDKGAVVDVAVLKKSGLVASSRKPVKILFRGEITREVTVRANAFSASAAAAIVKAGGKTERIAPAPDVQKGRKRPVQEKK